jgi:hypothetical protein
MKLFSWNKVSYWLEPVVALYKDSFWWNQKKMNWCKGYYVLFGEKAQGFLLVEFGVWGDTKISSEKNRGGGQVFLLLAVLRIRNVYPRFRL